MSILRGAPRPLRGLIEGFKRLPGIGQKTATRLALYLINQGAENMLELARSLEQAARHIKFCEICHNLTEEDVCAICNDHERDHSIIMVVEQSNDLMAVEMYADYTGVYHVLGGFISPLDGVAPSDLNIKSLLKRLREDDGIDEVIIATNPSTEGDATAIYLHKLIEPLGVKTTRIAQGLPSGGSLQFADKATLSKAIRNRQ